MTLTQLSSELSLPPPPPPPWGLNAFWELRLSFVNTVAKSPWNNRTFPLGFCLCSGEARDGRAGVKGGGNPELPFGESYHRTCDLVVADFSRARRPELQRLI